MNKTLIIVLLSIIFGCGPAYHLKRMKYHERMAYAKGAEIQKDTIFITKTIEIEKVKLDTIFKSKPQDTVYLTKDRLRIKYVIYLAILFPLKESARIQS